MAYVHARAVHSYVLDMKGEPVKDAEGHADLRFDYPTTVANLGRYCDHIDSWQQAELWASISVKLERASALLRERIQCVINAKVGARFEDAILVAERGGTIEVTEPEWELLRRVCNSAGSSAAFQATPGARLTPAGLMDFWPVLKDLSTKVGEAQEAPLLEGWLSD